ncbi:MAG TPA: trypsin-like peptidase domain-containing protein [Marmoricola sp.]|nr:trypsin-like peptidase domain-containing protein [Marmoricola sp.]
MKRSLTVAVMAAATLLAGGATATASESPSPTTSSSSGSASDVTTLERVAAYTQPSIVYIETTWSGYVYDTFNKMYINNGNPISVTVSCTGYVVRPDGYIATAGHCVNTPEFGQYFLLEQAAQKAIDQGYYQATDLTVEDILGFNDYVVQNQSGRRAKPQIKVAVWWPQSAGGVATAKGLPARIVKWQKFQQGDSALIKIEEDGMNALPLSDESIDVGTDVITIGYPASIDTTVDADLTPSYKDGSISSLKTVGGGLTQVYEISAQTSKGMSGGPTVNDTGEVVGVISFAPPSESQSFNFIQPVSATKELLGDAGQPNELSEDTQNYRAGLDAYFAGDKAEAVSKLSEVVDNQPTNALAKEYLDKAQELPEPAKDTTSSDNGGSNTGLIIGIIVGVLVLAAIAVLVLLMLSRSKKKKGPSAGLQSGPVYGGLPPSGGPTYVQPGVTGPTGPSTAVITPPPAQQQGIPAAPPQAAPAPPAPTPLPPAAATEAPAPVEAEAHEEVFCSSCGTKAEEPDQKFCKHCGHPL